jgi:hypothetical protein
VQLDELQLQILQQAGEELADPDLARLDLAVAEHAFDDVDEFALDGAAEVAGEDGDESAGGDFGDDGLGGAGEVEGGLLQTAEQFAVVGVAADGGVEDQGGVLVGGGLEVVEAFEAGLEDELEVGGGELVAFLLEELAEGDGDCYLVLGVLGGGFAADGWEGNGVGFVQVAVELD